MKTISEQLKDLGLRHGDLCEIEGYEGRAVVLLDLNLKELYARRDNQIFCTGELGSTVTCGWKAMSSITHSDGMPELVIYYTKILPKPAPAPSPKPLPEAVEAALIGKWEAYKEVWKKVDTVNFDTVSEYAKEAILAERDFARAILAEAAKVKTGEG